MNLNPWLRERCQLLTGQSRAFIVFDTVNPIRRLSYHRARKIVSVIRSWFQKLRPEIYELSELWRSSFLLSAAVRVPSEQKWICESRLHRRAQRRAMFNSWELSRPGYFSCEPFVLKRMNAVLSVDAAPRMTLEPTVGSKADPLSLAATVGMNF